MKYRATDARNVTQDSPIREQHAAALLENTHLEHLAYPATGPVQRALPLLIHVLPVQLVCIDQETTATAIMGHTSREQIVCLATRLATDV